MLRCMVKSLRDLPPDVCHKTRSERAFLPDVMCQVNALDIFHDEKMKFASLLGIVSSDDVDMGQLRGGADLLPKSLHNFRVVCQLAVDDLQRDWPIHDAVLGLKHRPHPAGSENPHNAVARMVDEVFRDLRPIFSRRSRDRFATPHVDGRIGIRGSDL